MISSKECAKCNATKPAAEFHRKKATKDGLHYYCKPCNSGLSKEYYSENREEKIKYQKEYALRNSDKIRDYKRDYARKKRQSDPLTALKDRIRCRTRDAFRRKNLKKSTKTRDMLGADWEAVKSHIESQFVEGMTWENMSEWHIDHIIPLAEASTEEELIILSHYSNLQPLWAEENLKKSSKTSY